jgi:hypothetical protein
MDHNGIDFNLLHTKHKFLDLLKTTINFSPTNQNNNNNNNESPTNWIL